MASLTLGKKVCFTCSTIIGKNKKSINCLTYGDGFMHAPHVTLGCQQGEIDICDTCLSNSLPFHSIDDLEFNFIFGNFNRIPSEEDRDRLTQLKFNPFNINTDILNLQNNENFLMVNLAYVTCNYHLPNDFSTISIGNHAMASTIRD
jgi:hypothetical protein